MLCARPARGRGSTEGCGAVEPFQDMTASPEPQDLFALHGDSLTGPGIAPHPSFTDPAAKVAELSQLDPMALRQTSGDRVQHRVESQFHCVPGQMRMRFEQPLKQFRTDHRASSFVLPGMNRLFVAKARGLTVALPHKIHILSLARVFPRIGLAFMQCH